MMLGFFTKNLPSSPLIIPPPPHNIVIQIIINIAVTTITIMSNDASQVIVSGKRLFSFFKPTLVHGIDTYEWCCVGAAQNPNKSTKLFSKEGGTALFG